MSTAPCRESATSGPARCRATRSSGAGWAPGPTTPLGILTRDDAYEADLATTEVAKDVHLMVLTTTGGCQSRDRAARTRPRGVVERLHRRGGCVGFGFLRDDAALYSPGFG
jgi:hypothetical protein